MRDTVTLERLKEVLEYEPETGKFFWLKALSFRVCVGDEAGNIEQGYVSIGIDNVTYRAQRLAWLYMTGEWPKHFVDHKDTDRFNNRWNNLREATNAENMRNAGPKVTNKTGFKGVYLESQTGRYRSSLTVNYKMYRGPRRDTPEDAYADYCEMAAVHHGEFTRLA